MKKLILALILAASTANAAGLYSDTTTGPATTGAANTNATLWSRPIAGGAVPDGNCIEVVSEWDPEVAGIHNAKISLNGLELTGGGPNVDGDSFFLTIWVCRSGRYGSRVRYQTLQPTTGAGAMTDVYDLATGFDWQAQQTLAVIGTSTATNGLTLKHAGLFK